MKFDKKYPEAQTDFEPKDLFIFKSGRVYGCMVCKDKTRWISISFGTYVCSEECLDALWKEYHDAC